MNPPPNPAEFLPTVEIKKYIVPILYRNNLYSIAIEQAHEFDGSILPYWTLSQYSRLSYFHGVHYKFKTAEDAFLYICQAPNVKIHTGKNPLPLPQSQTQPQYYETPTPPPK